MYITGGGVSDNDWSEPLPEIHHMDETELRAFRKAIFREVAETVEREIGTFKATVKTDMEAHLNKRVREVCEYMKGTCAFNQMMAHVHVYSGLIGQ